MKKLILTAFALLTTLSLQAQSAGTAIVGLNNYDANNLILFNSGSGGAEPAPIDGTWVQVLGGPTSANLAVVRSTDGLSVFGLADPGYFDGGFGMVTNVTGGSRAYFQVRAWRGAATWADALANPSAFTGQSDVFQTDTTAYPGQPSPPYGPSLEMPAFTISGQQTSKVQPVLTWNNPATLTYGAALGSGQLNATATFSGTNVPGSFAYTPPLGTVLNASNQPLQVLFTPADPGKFNSASASVTINILPAALVVTPSNGLRSFGEANPVFTGTMVGLTNNDPITASFNCAAAPTAPVGTYDITATLIDPNGRLANYSVTSNKGTLTVARATQTITFAALPDKKYNDPPFGLMATASSGLPVSYTNSNPSVATIAGATVTIVGPGLTVITAAQAGNSNYLAATVVAQTLTVNGPPVITLQPHSLTNYVGATVGIAIAQGIGAEQFNEEFHHVGLTAEVALEVGAQPVRQDRLHRHRGLGQPVRGVHADLQRGQVGRGGLGLLVGPDGLAGPDSPRHQLARSHRVVGAVGADRYPVAGLRTGMVIAGKPGRRAVGLTGDQYAVGEFFETDFAPMGSDQAGRAAVADHDRHRRPCR